MTAQGPRAALIASLFASAALAGDGREPIRLTYEAVAGCPSAKDFEAAVLERTSRGRLASPGEIAREYRIQVRSTGRSSVARLEFPAAGGGTVAREVTAGDCAEAARAIAVVTALAFDAEVAAALEARSGTADSLRAEPAPTAPAPAPPVQPPVAAPPPPATATKPRTAPPAEKPSLPRDPSLDERPAPVAWPSQAPELELGARATLTSPKAPEVLPGAEVFAAIAGPPREWLIQIGVAGERGSRFESGPGDAQFSFVGGRLQGCFFGVALAKSVDLVPCALFEGGARFAKGYDIEEPGTAVDPWFALGLNARVAWDLGPAKLLLEGGPLFPLRPQDRVVFGDIDDPDNKVVHDVPWIGAFASLGLAFGVP